MPRPEDPRRTRRPFAMKRRRGGNVQMHVVRTLVFIATLAAAVPGAWGASEVNVRLGIRVIATTAQLCTVLGVTANKAAFVLEVEPHGPAERAGLQAGDMVTHVAGTAVGDTE